MFAGNGEHLNSVLAIDISLILSAVCVTWVSWFFFRGLRSHFKLRVPVWAMNCMIIVTVGASLHTALYKVNYLVALLLFLFVDLVLIRLAFKGKFSELLFAFLYAGIHILAFEGIVFCICAWFDRITLQQIIWMPEFRTQALGYTFLLTAVFFQILKKFQIGGLWDEMIKQNRPLEKHMLGAEMFVLMILFLETGVYYVPTVGYSIKMFYLALNLMIITVFHLIISYIIQSKRLIEENVAREEMLGQQLKLQLDNFQKQAEDMEYFRRFKHDCKNQLRGLGYLIEQGQGMEKVRNYLMEMTDNLEGINSYYRQYSNNRLLDAILQDADRDCGKKKIRFSATVQIEDNFHLSDINLCTVFSNVLNNAIEAAEKVPEESERFIKLESVKKTAWNGVCCSNSYAGELTRQNGEIITGKEDFANHGFGLRKIRELVGAAGGMIVIDTADRVFSISLMMHQ